MTDPLREDRFQQTEVWQDTYGHVHKLVEMPRPYREAVLSTLRRDVAVEPLVVEVRSAGTAHVVWMCRGCGMRVRHDRPREVVDVQGSSL